MIIITIELYKYINTAYVRTARHRANKIDKDIDLSLGSSGLQGCREPAQGNDHH